MPNVFDEIEAANKSGAGMEDQGNVFDQIEREQAEGNVFDQVEREQQQATERPVSDRQPSAGIQPSERQKISESPPQRKRKQQKQPKGQKLERKQGNVFDQVEQEQEHGRKNVFDQVEEEKQRKIPEGMEEVMPDVYQSEPGVLEHIEAGWTQAGLNLWRTAAGLTEATGDLFYSTLSTLTPDSPEEERKDIQKEYSTPVQDEERRNFIQKAGQSLFETAKEKQMTLQYAFPSGDITKDPEVLKDPGWWSQTLASTAGSYLPTVLASMINPAAGAAIGASMESAPSYSDLKREDMARGEAAARSIATGIGVYALEKIGLNKLFKGASKGAIRKHISAGLTEGLQEWAEEPWQAVTENLGREGVAMTDLGEEVLGAMRQGVNVIIPSMILGGLSSGAVTKAQQDQVKRLQREMGIEDPVEPANVPKATDEPAPAQPARETAEREGDFKDIKKDAKAEGVKLLASENKERVNISNITVPEESRDQGVGTKYMNRITDYADRTGKRIELTPTDEFGGDKQRLVEFYKGFGFVENKGQNKDYSISETMYRPPAEQQPAPPAERGERKIPVSRQERRQSKEFRSRPPSNTFSTGRKIVADWALQEPQTRRGKKLVKDIAKDQQGQKVGVRSIAEFVEERLGIEVRRAKSQVSKAFPAKHDPDRGITWTERPNSQIQFHESAHRLHTLLERENAITDGMRQQFAEFSKTEQAEAVSAENWQEGMAEWMRMYITNYDAVADEPITRTIENTLAETNPDALATIRDAGRAWNQHLNRPVAARFSSESKDRGRDKPVRDVIGRFIDKSLFTVARREHASEAFVRHIERLIKREAPGKRDIFKMIDSWKPQAEDVRASHAMISKVSEEIDQVYQGSKKARNGVRMIRRGERKVTWLTDKSFRDIVQMISAEKWHQAQTAFQAQAALARYNEKGLEYAGRDNGITPEDLQQIVDQARNEIPGYDKAFNAQEEYYNALLEVVVESGEISREEADKIKAAYEHYTFLEPNFKPAGGRGVSGETTAAIKRAFGYQTGYADVAHAAYDRTRNVLKSYYDQGAKKSIRDAVKSGMNDENLSYPVREAIGRVLVPVQMPMSKVANVPQGELQKVIAKSLQDTLGTEVDADNIVVSDEGLDVFRPRKPHDIDIITIHENGESKFYMVNDPMIYDMYARRKDAPKWFSGLMQEMAAVTENFKRPITSTPGFGLVNVGVRDAFQSMFRGEDAKTAIPFYNIYRALKNRFIGKFGNPENYWPDLQEQAEMLSHSFHETETSQARRVMQSNFVQMLAEGWHSTPIENKVIRRTVNAVHPANIVNTMVKPLDIFYYALHARQFNTVTESLGREGAALARLDKGASLQEAFRAYQDVTGRFGAKAGSQALAEIYRAIPFANPALQINYDIMKELSDPDPRVSGARWARLAEIGGIFTALAALNVYMSDEDDEEMEKERSSESKARYMNWFGIRLPFPPGPLGLVSSMMYNGTRNFIQKGSPKINRRTAVTILEQTGDSLGIGDLSPLPPIMQAWKENRQNWNSFFNSHIIPPYLEDLPAEDQYRFDTPEFYRKIGKWFNYSPEKISHLVGSGVARQLDDTVRMADRFSRGRDVLGEEKANYPEIGRFFIRNPIGWSSESVKKLSLAEKKFQSLRHRLKMSNNVRDRHLLAYIDDKQGKVAPPSDAPPQLVMAIESYKKLHSAHNKIREIQGMVKKVERMDGEAETLRQMMTEVAQTALMMNDKSYKDIAEQAEKQMSLYRDTEQVAPQQARP